MRSGSPLPGRHSEPPRERMREGALIGESGLQCDIGQCLARIGEQGQRGIEPQALQIPVRCFAERLAENLMKPPHPEAAMRGEIGNA